MESLKYKLTNPHLKAKQNKSIAEKEKQEDTKINSEPKVYNKELLEIENEHNRNRK